MTQHLHSKYSISNLTIKTMNQTITVCHTPDTNSIRLRHILVLLWNIILTRQVCVTFVLCHI